MSEIHNAMAVKGTYIYEFKHPALTADCVVFGYEKKELRVLLVRRGHEKESSTTAFEGSWALPGGFMDVESDKTIAHTAARELREETGLKLPASRLREFATYSDIDRDPRERVVTVAHYALVKLTEVRAGTDADKVEWFPISGVPKLAFDHNEILRKAFETIKERIFFEPVCFEMLPEEFTMPDVQDIYDTILEKNDTDRRNFSSKMLKQGFLVEVPGRRPEGAGPRVPFVYTFSKEKYDEMKSKGNRFEF